MRDLDDATCTLDAVTRDAACEVMAVLVRERMGRMAEARLQNMKSLTGASLEIARREALEA